MFSQDELMSMIRAGKARGAGGVTTLQIHGIVPLGNYLKIN